MKKLTLIFTILFISAFANAQEQTKNEILVFGATGLSTLKYESKVGNYKSGFKSAFGLRDNYYLNNHWSLATGVELSFSVAKTNIDTYSDAYNSNDGEYDFEFRTTVSDYEEKQKATFLDIPIIAQFQLPVSPKSQLYVAGGVKLGFPLSQRYEVSSARMQNSGFYPDWSGEEDLVLDEQKFMGFGTFDRKAIKGELDFKMAYLFSLETGIKWKSGNKGSIYTGLYLDYGLNDINSGNNKKLVEYNTADPENFINNSITQTQLIDKLTPMALGLKLSFAFGK